MNNVTTSEHIQTPQNEYLTQEIASIEIPMTALVEQLKPHLEQDEYSMLIGDDTSGRIPTLILHNIVSHQRRRQQLPPIPTLHVQGGRYVADQHFATQIEDLVKRHQPSTKKKVLLVTEHIDLGDTVKRYSKLLGEHGLRFDVATLATYHPLIEYDEMGIYPPGTQLFSGTLNTERNKAPLIYMKDHLSGMTQAFSRGMVPKRVDGRRETIVSARQDVRTMSDKIIARLFT